MHPLIRLPGCASCLLLFALATATTHAQSTEPAATRDVLREWVATKALFSEEKETWAEEKAALQDTISILEQEKAMLEKRIEEREEAADAAADRRSELSQRREKLESAAKSLGDTLAGYEDELKGWVDRLPQILKDEIDPLLRRLRKSDPSVGLGRRLQTVVGILTQIDKFNSTVTYAKTLREDPDSGAKRESDTLYFGIGYAVYTNSSGSLAGYGKPGPDGWVWETVPEMAPDVQKLVAIYKNNAPAAYVPVSVTVD